MLANKRPASQVRRGRPELLKDKQVASKIASLEERGGVCELQWTNGPPASPTRLSLQPSGPMICIVRGASWADAARKH